jgi:8-amino-7-oxononanoate synthase
MSEGNALERRVRARMTALEADGLLRSLQPPSGIDLCSNDYLGLSRHPLLAARLAEGARAEGCGSTGSRLLRGERTCFDHIERRFARFKGAERALYFGAGYLANLAVLTTLPEAGDVILSDERNHASLIDGARLSRARTIVFPHNDVAALRQKLDELPVSGIRFIVVESLFSMDGDMAPLARYAALCRARGAVLVVDEAHAVGIYGPRGTGLTEGISEDMGVRPPSDPGANRVPRSAEIATVITVNTAGKALGVSGAFVAGPEWAIDYLVQRARSFVFSTAPPPALASALHASLEVIRDEPDRRQRLKARARYLRDALASAGIEIPAGSSQIIPVMIGDNERAVLVARALQADGFDVRAIRPPSVPPGTARLRVSVNSELSEETLDRFVASLAAALKEAASCSAVSS